MAFEYPAGPDAPAWPGWEGWSEAEPAEAGARAPGVEPSGAPADAGELRLRTEFERRLGEETRRSYEAGREKGRQEGGQAERDALSASQAAAEERRKRQAAELIESFAQERDKYLSAVEHEVVKLALAVAARILRREAQMDPLLLTGAVRVALGQLSGSTEMRLRVPALEKDLWSEAMALMPNLAVRPTVVGDDEMRLGDCAIETELGSVDLGIRAQLGEIERGFFDRAGGARVRLGSSANAARQAGQEVRP